MAPHLLRFTDRPLTGALRLVGRSECLANLPLHSRQLAVQALSFCPGTLDHLLHFAPGLVDAGLRGFARAVRAGEACLEVGILPARPGQLLIQANRILGRYINGVGEVSNLRLGTLARTLKFGDAAVHLFQFSGQALVFPTEQRGLGASFGTAFCRAEQQLIELSPGRFRNLIELGRWHLLVYLRLLFCVRLVAGFYVFDRQDGRDRRHRSSQRGA